VWFNLRRCFRAQEGFSAAVSISWILTEGILIASPERKNNLEKYENMMTQVEFE
jgi:hypothetical protein